MKKFAKLFELEEGYQLVVYKGMNAEYEPCLDCVTRNEKDHLIEAKFGFSTAEKRNEAFDEFDQLQAEAAFKALTQIEHDGSEYECSEEVKNAIDEILK